MHHPFLRITLLALYAVAAIDAAAALRWLTTTYNFGAFDEDSGPVTAIFRAVNDGTEPLVIIDARASCGCTTPVYSTDAINPGDTTVVKVTYDPGGRPGRFEKSVTVVTSDTEQPKTRLLVKGVVIGQEASVSGRYPVEAGPIRLSRSALLLGDIDTGRHKSVFFDGYNRSTDSTYTTVTDVPRWISVRCIPERVGPGEQVTYSFYVSADDTRTYGVVTDTVTITSISGDRRGEYRLPVILTVKEDFSHLTDKDLANAPVATVDQPLLALGHITADAPVEGTFDVRNTGHRPLIIRRAYSMDPGVTVSTPATTLKPGKTGHLHVTITPTAATSGPRTYSARIILITNDPLTPTQTLRLTAER